MKYFFKFMIRQLRKGENVLCDVGVIKLTAGSCDKTAVGTI